MNPTIWNAGLFFVQEMASPFEDDWWRLGFWMILPVPSYPGLLYRELLSPTELSANYSGLVSVASGDFCFLRERSSNAIKSARSSTSIAIPAKRDGEISSGGGGGGAVVLVVATGPITIIELSVFMMVSSELVSELGEELR